MESVPFRFAAWFLMLLLAVAPTGCRAQAWPLWQAYTAAFVDGQGRVIDHQRGDLTTSEGQAYGMFFALVANDRSQFDKLLAWTQLNLAEGDLTAHLPAWKWGRAANGQWKALDTNAASDADLWMAYTLIEAGRLWREPRYAELGKLLAGRIAEQEVATLPGFGPMLLPGATGYQLDAATWILNPSYVPLPLLVRLAKVDPSGPWAAIAANVPLLLEKSARHGFALDWVSYSQTGGFQPAPAPAGKDGAMGSYDAIRVYLWAGMTDSATPGSSTMLRAVSGMSNYLGHHLLPPEEVNGDGTVAAASGPVGFSAALIPYLVRSGADGPLEKQEARLTAQRDPATRLYGRPPSYYDQNLALFAEGWTAQRFSFSRDGDLRVKWKKS